MLDSLAVSSIVMTETVVEMQFAIVDEANDPYITSIIARSALFSATPVLSSLTIAPRNQLRVELHLTCTAVQN